MIEDGSRLTLSLGSDSFFITDTLTGKSIIFKEGHCSAFTLDKDVILNKISTLLEALNTYTVKSVLPFQKLLYYHSTLGILLHFESCSKLWSVYDH